MVQRERLIVVLGPTASGKTELAVRLAQKLHTEIISGDSQLVYRGFDIGSAKPTLKERQGVVHHMIDILPAEASFNMADFHDQVKPLITQLNHQGRIPILVGGTGLYIQSLLEGYQLNATAEDTEFRSHMEKLAAERGSHYVYELLQQQDPQAAANIHPNNLRRVIRALEVAHLGDEHISAQKASTLVYDAFVIGLNWDRQILYDRINQRVDKMLARGLVQEVQQLLASGVSAECQAMRGIGYKELLPCLKGEISLDEAADTIRKNTRHFAKRQMTWFRRMPYIHWFTAQQTVDDTLEQQLIAYLGKPEAQ